MCNVPKLNGMPLPFGDLASSSYPLTRGLDSRLIHLQILFSINALQKKIIVTLLTVSWAADGVLQACHVELVMT